jgi:hypothetical protein
MIYLSTENNKFKKAQKAHIFRMLNLHEEKKISPNNF